jgi:hypothetical protein
MSRIENEQQLKQLRSRFDQVQGAMALHQAMEQQVQASIRGYLEHVSLLAGIEVGEGDRVTVDWKDGEVTVEHANVVGGHELVANGVAE